MNDLDTTWVHPGRITHVETAPGGGYRVTIDATNVRFAARNLAGRAVIRDLMILGKLENLDATDVSYVVDLECLQDYVRVGAPVMVETDADDEYVIHLHPDALYQSPDLPRVLYLVCPAEGRGRWCSNVDESVYQCPCGVRWDVLPEQDGEMDRE